MDDHGDVKLETPADRLRFARERSGLGLAGPQEAADRFGWNPNTYKSHENGARGYKTDDAKKYARAYKVSSGWLMTGLGPHRGLVSDDEYEFLALYRRLTAEGRRFLHATVEGVLAAAERGEMPIPIIKKDDA